MAMIKSIELENGVEAVYHRILGMRFDYMLPPQYLEGNPNAFLVEVEMGSYLSAATRNSGKLPIYRSVATVVMTGEATRGQVYAALAAHPNGAYNGAVSDEVPPV